MTEPSWKTSNQTKNYKNVKLDVLDFQKGTLNSVYKTETVSSTQKTTRQTSVPSSLGVETENFYSKLSLGDNEGKITDTGQSAVDINTSSSNLFSGETSTIAIQEKSDGKNLHGFSYVEGVQAKNLNTAAPSITAVGISANDRLTDADSNNCAAYIDSQKCLTLNTIPRNLPNSTLRLGLSGDSVNPQIKMDITF